MSTEPKERKDRKKEEKKREEKTEVPRERASVVDIKVDEVKFKSWLDLIYDIEKVTDEELQEYYKQFQYQGFNREDILKQLFIKITEPKIVIQTVIVCALRGPKAASVIKLMNGVSLQEMGIPASGGKGTRKLTCSRITSATADLAAYFMKKLKVPKRIAHDLPGWLQFPAAGSIKMNDEMRRLHRDFSEKFSLLIGGVFNEQIYWQMIQNAYIDSRLNLWGD